MHKNEGRDVTQDKPAGGESEEHDLSVRRQRALYRAEHRGTREMDFLLGRFARAQVAQMTAPDLELFEKLLTLPDPELAQALIDGTGEFEEATASLIERISLFHQSQSK
ncbi:MAG: succinate dehydrogenase assembly factor 2 [Hyphomicrobiaceae bacterium]|nr:succinate dehydrogenase assembly factor 2 [Hyphomicrobiaceae bacterium]